MPGLLAGFYRREIRWPLLNGRTPPGSGSKDSLEHTGGNRCYLVTRCSNPCQPVLGQDHGRPSLAWDVLWCPFHAKITGLASYLNKILLWINSAFRFCCPLKLLFGHVYASRS
jgi:hypothetical protein